MNAMSGLINMAIANHLIGPLSLSRAKYAIPALNAIQSKKTTMSLNRALRGKQPK